MCGIIGYIGRSPAMPLLIAGLEKLEYRGYDSAGVATVANQHIAIHKRSGKVAELAKAVKFHAPSSNIGIGHTRWATHGAPTETNAHPHLGYDGSLAVAHNGVIDNYGKLTRELATQLIKPVSGTDSEVIAHWLAYLASTNHHSGRDAIIACYCQALRDLKGTFALAILSLLTPGWLLGACRGSPLVVGIGLDCHFLASDPAVLEGIAHTIIPVKDGDLVALSEDERSCFQIAPATISVSSARQTLPAQFEHQMLKEIYEQPMALTNAMAGRLCSDEASAELGACITKSTGRLILTGCGTSYHAGLVGEYLLEDLARIPVEVEYASEFRYRNPPIGPATVVVAITQSGETADTLAALREAQRRGHQVLAICNTKNSSIARAANETVLLNAGQEVGVASTKAFTSQVMVLALLALRLGRMWHLSYTDGCKLVADLQQLPQVVADTIARCVDEVTRIADRYFIMRSCLYLGRGYLYPVALEGALKLREIGYISTSAMPAAEIKHGPIALVDQRTPTFILLQGPDDPLHSKIMNAVEEIKARHGPVIAIACDGDRGIADLADEVVYVPKVNPQLQPIISIVPLQLLAYQIAVCRGCDVDKPRNLAKSVTVE